MSRILFDTLNGQPNKPSTVTQAQLADAWAACRTTAWIKTNPKLDQVAALAVFNCEIGQHVIGRQNYESFLGLVRAARITMIGIGTPNQNHTQIVQAITDEHGLI